MLRRVLHQIQTHKLPIRLLLRLRHTELRIHQPDVEFPRAAERLVDVGALEREIHAPAECEVLEDGNELGDLTVAQELKPDVVGFEVLVDWNDHAAAGDGENCCGSGFG